MRFREQELRYARLARAVALQNAVRPDDAAYLGEPGGPDGADGADGPGHAGGPDDAAAPPAEPGPPRR